MLRKKTYQSIIFIALMALSALSACNKDYYEDSGLQIGMFKESGLSFLKEKPFYFDSLVVIIHLAELDQVLEDSSITFFAPTDHSIAKTMNGLNAVRHEKFEDSLTLEDIPKEVWRKFLNRY